jgi:hypothetical protein
MHVARRTIILILALVIFITAAGAQSLDDPRLDPEERRKAVREQELRWNLREEDMVVQPTTSGFPGAEVFRVLPGQTNELVLASGTRIYCASRIVSSPAWSRGFAGRSHRAPPSRGFCIRRSSYQYDGERPAPAP